jgi:hypothetical protein
MGTIIPAVTRVNPHYAPPEFIVQQNQASGAFETIGGSEPLIRLGEGDQYVYMKTLQIRTKVAAGQSNVYQSVPSCEVVYGEISTPTYLMRARAQYDHHDTAAGARVGLSVPNAQSLGMRQAHFQQTRNALLYGFNPQNGEGLLNAPGTTEVNLPPDQFGNTTFVTYDPGDFAVFLLEQWEELKARMYQLGMPARLVILGPQRILGPLAYQGIIQLTQYQRIGAGTASVRAMVGEMLEQNADGIVWAYDDTLIGKGANGNDAILIVCPEISPPTAQGYNTNIFSTITPSLSATTLQFADMAAPREIPTPLPFGAIDVGSELRITSGWPVRPEAVTIVTVDYE